MADSIPIPANMAPFDDADLTRARNGQPATARHVSALVHAINALLNRGRNIFSWWGMDDTTDTDDLMVQIYNHHMHAGFLAGHALYLPPNGTRDADQAVQTIIDADTFTDHLDYDLASVTAKTYPAYSDLASWKTTTAYGYRSKLRLGSKTANGPGLRCGLLFEPRRFSADPADPLQVIVPDGFVPGREILGVSETGGAAIDNLRGAIKHLWNRARPQVGWSRPKPETNYVPFTASSQEWRFIHGQTIGDGATAPDDVGPAIPFPLYHASRGIATTVKVGVYVYARMSGGTDTGEIGISHLEAGTGMTSIAALTNPPTISGTTWAWYPDPYDGGTDPVEHTPATFLARTDFPYERIVLCARSSGATDHVQIGAYSIIPIPSQVDP